ncbi:hypothetical protein ACFPZL_09805 [Leucobacter soli]|uniref:DUF4287 domain-containing protein n=1 Tax=Leucobacter soli TaxID=2812850 RepID=A0A916NNE4_9MICO|nr:hypothetical protein [Leucobacter soli]CAG7607241.1 hypothetical protein LEUCIP111803_01003 [Leucobacter soli]
MSDGAPNGRGNRTRGESIAAIERATGLAWNEWLTHFDSHGAAQLGHAEIARIARAAMREGLTNPDWWAQAVAIAYEQHTGLRVPGQSSSGTFRVSASRTLTLDRDAAVSAWVSAHGQVAEHLGHAVTGARDSRTEKRTFYRFDLEGAGRIEVSGTPNAKDSAKTTLGVSHEGLADGERIEEWRAHWKGLLAEL